MKSFKIPCGETQTTGWNCNEGHLCPNCNLKIQIIPLDDIFYSVPQPSSLINKWEKTINEIIGEQKTTDETNEEKRRD